VAMCSSVVVCDNACGSVRCGSAAGWQGSQCGSQCTMWQCVQQCTAVRQCAAHSSAVCGSVRRSMRQCGSVRQGAAGCGSSVRQCGSEAACAAVRQCAAVNVAMCGSARDGVCLFVFNNYFICVKLYSVDFELS
jgi:hypothetical protein